MKAGRRVVWGAAALAVAAVASGIAVASGFSAEDDLAVVKRAVAQSTQAVPDTAAAARTADPAPPREEASPRRAAGKEPTWLKVRVTEKGTSRKKVTVNLPLALVRVLDDGDFPIDFGCGDDHKHRRCSIKLAEVLDALESGQDLVEVDDEHQLVRVWVE